MTIILFVIILVILILGHEFGHFVVAKLSGMRVPEFGIGFPPKLWGKKIGDTEYTVNALPFGGFVKIVGEDITAETSADPIAFSNRPKYLQGATLLAGPAANLLLAFIFSSVAFGIGIPAATDSGYPAAYIHDSSVTVLDVLPDSPAAIAGLQSGDQIESITVSGEAHTILAPEDISPLLQSAAESVTLTYIRDGKQESAEIIPKAGLLKESPETKAFGVATASVGTLILPFGEAIAAGFEETVQNAWAVLTGIIGLIGRAVTFTADFSSVAGPVGIATLVGSAAHFGWGSVLSFAALISVNLGVLNLFPFPALDGGRFAFVLAEAISGRRVPAKIANTINTVGFALLVILMLVVTTHDVWKLFA